MLATRVCRAVRWVVPCAVLFGVGLVPAKAFGQEPLRYQYNEGETRRYEISQVIEQDMQFMGQAIEQTMEQTINLQAEVQSVDSEGNGTLVMSFERIRMVLDNPQMTLEFDTDDDAPPEQPEFAQIMEAFDAMLALEFTMVLDPRGQVIESDVSGLEDLQATLPPEMADLLGGAFSAETFEQMATGGLVLPEEAVSEGDTWTQEVSQSVAGFGSMEGEVTYTVEGEDEFEGRAALAITSAGDLQIEFDPDSPIAALLGDAEIEAGPQENTYYFDTDAGALVGFESQQVMTMSFMNIVMDMDMQTTMRLLPEEGSSRPRQ